MSPPGEVDIVALAVLVAVLGVDDAAEHGDAIDVIQQQALAEGKTEPRWHAATRPPLTEAEATNRSIMLAQVAGCPLYVVHVSCREAAEPIARAKAAGWRVWGETCTQYLFIDET